MTRSEAEVLLVTPVSGSQIEIALQRLGGSNFTKQLVVRREEHSSYTMGISYVSFDAIVMVGDPSVFEIQEGKHYSKIFVTSGRCFHDCITPTSDQVFNQCVQLAQELKDYFLSNLDGIT